MTTGRCPLVIGVTGHRDLVDDEIPVLEDRVERFLTSLQAQFPDLPLLVLSALAEGADQLVARVARRSGVAVKVLLPMTADRYRDALSPAARSTFDELLADSESIELRGAELINGERGEEVLDPYTAAYVYLGVYLAAHSHVLLALWDGKETTAEGGNRQRGPFSSTIHHGHAEE